MMDDSQTDGVVKAPNLLTAGKKHSPRGRRARFTWIPRHGEPAINLQRQEEEEHAVR